LKVVVFDVKGDIGHFRRPDTTATHLTYPFIPPTAVKGLVGAILGIEDFVTNDKIGIQILSEVNMVSQQMSMLKMGNTFNRPTTVQLLINPAYRIYYSGDEYVDELEERLKNKQFVYHTYLGSAFGLTTPIYRMTKDLSEIESIDGWMKCKTVVPIHDIKEVKLVDGYFYQRASGFMLKYYGERTFGKTVDFLFEQKGNCVIFKPADKIDNCILRDSDGETLCLV